MTTECHMIYLIILGFFFHYLVATIQQSISYAVIGNHVKGIELNHAQWL